jgi:hypothetical protein
MLLLVNFVVCDLTRFPQFRLQTSKNGLLRFQPKKKQSMVERGPDVWLEEILKCQYLPENDMKILCEKVKELLMEESNIQPVQSPVTVCGGMYKKTHEMYRLWL